MAPAVVARAALTPETRAILDEAAMSVGPEKEARKNLETLKKRPREQVLKALREGLVHGGPFVIVAARGAQALDAKELVPDLLKTAQTNDQWQLLAALEQLSRNGADRAKVEELFSKKLASASAPAKIVMLDAFSDAKSQLPAASFDALLNDANLGVRRAAVRHFLASRAAYSAEEQSRRFKLAFKTKPYQARLEAFEFFATLPAKDRRSIASAFDPAMCANEKNTHVKAACDKAAKGAK